MKKVVFTVITCLLYIIGFSQICIDWQQCYGSMWNDRAYGIIEKRNGYWVTGSVGEQSGMVSCDLPSSGGDWMIEIDDYGSVLGESCFDYQFAGTEGFFKGNGDIFFAVGLRFNSNRKDQLNINKFNLIGENIWEKSFGREDKGFWRAPSGAATPDGGVIVVVSTAWAGGDIGNYYGMDDVWVVKIDSLGNLEWETTLGSNGNENGLSVSCASDGGYYVCMDGHPGPNGSISQCRDMLETDAYNGHIAKLDPDGNILWHRCYGGNEWESIYNMVELEDGILLVCDTNSEDGDVEGAGYHLGYPHGDEFYGKTYDIWLIKTDFDGNILWSKCYGGTGHEFPLKVFQNEDGGFTVFGTTESLDGDVASTSNMHPHQPEVGRKIWVFRIDADGNMLWERAIGHYGNTPIYLGDVIKHDDVTYTLAATSPGSSSTNTLYNGDLNCSNSEFCGYNNYWVLHITDIFNYDDPTGIEEQPKVVPFTAKVYPNPTQGLLTVSGKDIRQVRLYDLLGQQVAAAPSYNGNNVMLNTSSLAAGIYMVQVFAENGMYVKHVVVGGAY